MAEIIRDPLKEDAERITYPCDIECRFCRSTIRFQLSDVKYHLELEGLYSSAYTFVVCPKCKVGTNIERCIPARPIVHLSSMANEIVGVRRRRALRVLGVILLVVVFLGVVYYNLYH